MVTRTQPLMAVRGEQNVCGDINSLLSGKKLSLKVGTINSNLIVFFLRKKYCIVAVICYYFFSS